MTIHKEGIATITITMIVLTALNFVVFYFFNETHPIIFNISLFASLFLLIMILQFFRSPERNLARNERLVIAPADGKVVVIEETEETEVLKERRIQVSIFMSPIN